MMKRFCKITAVLLALAGAVLFALAYREYKPFLDTRVKQDALQEGVVTEAKEPFHRQIDFKALKKINPEIIGWLYIPQIEVDLPILQGTDDATYLIQSFDGGYSPLGSVFTWAHAEEKLTDPHICLFGHNMLSGQMFGRLSRFQDAAFLKNDPICWIYTPERTKEIEIYRVETVHESAAIFQETWTDPAQEGQTVTFATCTGYEDTAYRLAVTGRVIREKMVL